MGDYYFAAVDVEATPEQAESLGQQVVQRLVGEGVIQPTLDPEATLGGPGYRPGDRLNDLFEVSPGAYAPWGMFSCGMEVVAERWVNTFGFICVEAFVCPRCSARYSLDDSVGQQFGEAIGQFLKGNDQPLVHCPSCRHDSPAPGWYTKPHFGFAHLAFIFWNWPPLDSPSWKIDILKLIAETTHHKIVVTYGKV